MQFIARDIDHINLTVPNIEKALEFYTGSLGFTVQDRYKNGGMEFVFITNGKIVYELMENPLLKTATIDHIAYVSEDIEKDFQHFKEQDSSLLLGEIGYVDFLFENGVYYFFIKGAGNEKVEFCQKKG